MLDFCAPKHMAHNQSPEYEACILNEAFIRAEKETAWTTLMRTNRHRASHTGQNDNASLGLPELDIVDHGSSKTKHDVEPTLK
jgi:hypothetical protein